MGLMKNRILIPLVIAATVLVTLYTVYLFQSGKVISFNLSETKAARPTQEEPGVVEDYTVIVWGFIGWLDVTFAGTGFSDSPVRRY